MLVDYGSDSDDEDNQTTASPQQPTPAKTAPKPSPVVRPAGPPPVASSSSSSSKLVNTTAPAGLPTGILSGLSLPPPKSTTAKRTFKLELPSTASDDLSSESSVPQPPLKKARTTLSRDDGVPSSSASTLFSMLPAPKMAALVQKKPEPKPIILKPLEVGLDGKLEESDLFARGGEDEVERDGAELEAAFDFTPRNAVAGSSSSVSKGQTSTETKVVKPLSLKPSTNGSSSSAAASKKPKKDFFGLGSASTSAASSSTFTSSSDSSTSIISAAPSLPNFTPPEPTASDAYPGYYQLPSGKWEAYDPLYYNSFWAQVQKEEKERLETERAGAHGKEWNNLLQGREEIGEVDMRKIAKEQSEEMQRKALRAPPKPEHDGPPAKKAGGKAGQKNQMSALIQNAQANRAALEEQIARSKANKRNAGTAYGF